MISLLLALATSPALANDPAAERISAAAAAFEAAEAMMSTGQDTPESVYRWSVRWMTAITEARPEEAEAARKAHHSRMTTLQATIADQVASGAAAPARLAAARYYVAEATVWLEAAP